VCQPLYNGAGAIGAIEYQVVATLIAEQSLDLRVAPLHLGVGNARIFGPRQSLEPLRQPRHGDHWANFLFSEVWR
jgi:hypothetical protein